MATEEKFSNLNKELWKTHHVLERGPMMVQWEAEKNKMIMKILIYIDWERKYANDAVSNLNLQFSAGGT